MPPPAPRAGSDPRLERLVRAGIAIGARRELVPVLQDVVDAAREVIGARYAALGVLDDRGEGLRDFVFSGLGPADRARIGDLPRGEGILGLLIREPRLLRLRDLRAHPAARGFPPGHPPMRSFLGVPVVGREGPIGNLYLTEKAGGAEFTEEDERIAVLLAAQAAVAIDNAILNERAARLVVELERMRRSRDVFYAMVSHEIRNALTAVHGWAGLLLRHAGNPEPRAAREVHEAAEIALDLLNDLLDLSRIEAAQLSLVPQEADARAIAHQAVAAVEPQARDREVRVQLDDASDPLPCRTDPRRVHQVLVNLLRNAIRHSPAGEAVAMRVRSGPERIHYEVSDRGEGIPRADLERIFHAFAGSQSGEESGVGLGLALSRHLARLLGGELRVESRLGAGTMFTLELPPGGPDG